MNRITAIALLSIAGSIASSNALAQTYGLRAAVPFDFTVSNKTLPSGTYTITSPSSGVTEIQGKDKNVMALIATSRSANVPANGSKLVFTRYGDHYFLREILSSSSGAMNVRVPTSTQEKRIESQRATLEVATLTLVAAK